MRAARRSRRRRLKLGLAAALATMALATPTALARPAGAGAGAGFVHLAHGPSGVSTASATPPVTGDVMLHRDGSKADPFVADLTATGAPAADGFDWGDAAVGVGTGMIVSVLGFAAIGAYGGRRPRTA
jgi:hypothetical protein